MQNGSLVAFTDGVRLICAGAAVFYGQRILSSGSKALSAVSSITQGMSEAEAFIQDGLEAFGRLETLPYHSEFLFIHEKNSVG